MSCSLVVLLQLHTHSLLCPFLSFTYLYVCLTCVRPVCFMLFLFVFLFFIIAISSFTPTSVYSVTNSSQIFGLSWQGDGGGLTCDGLGSSACSCSVSQHYEEIYLKGSLFIFHVFFVFYFSGFEYNQF